jgi:sporulation integral membrane protein YtvI
LDITEKRRAFLIRFLYGALWCALIYLFMEYALPLVMPFLIAFGIAFLLKPLINKIAEKTPLSRRLVAILLLSLLYLILGTLLVFLGSRLVVSLMQLFSNLPHFYQTTIDPALASISEWIEGFLHGVDPAVAGFLDTAGDSISSTISNIISAISSGALNILGGIASGVPWFVVSFVLTIIASYFFVVDYYKITIFLYNQLGETAQRRLVLIKNFVINVLFKFAKAYAILLSITFVEVSIGLLILRVPGAILLALIIALVDILPVFGTGTILIPWAVFSLISGNYFLGIGLLVVYAIITVARQVLEPRVVGRQIGLYPLLTLISMFLGARLFGFWGLFGLPVALTAILYLNRVGEIHLFNIPPAPPAEIEQQAKSVKRTRSKKEKPSGKN